MRCRSASIGVRQSLRGLPAAASTDRMRSTGDGAFQIYSVMTLAELWKHCATLAKQVLSHDSAAATQHNPPNKCRITQSHTSYDPPVPLISQPSGALWAREVAKPLAPSANKQLARYYPLPFEGLQLHQVPVPLSSSPLSLPQPRFPPWTVLKLHLHASMLSVQGRFIPHEQAPDQPA